ncbi:hypothetical protein LO762_14885 [Actinocorallia sp. API 0066]|uniref:hypothetical protein n=1 Tax=Actinocorallia sp. API 0066 TaxID=2896846 RepID=UPI001E42B94A|nr:hypothetical protein [Actinocorallia sp. API 0066]MCD0450465.1 hypothetical protein [Actinocorallia sp. API 0066]
MTTYTNMLWPDDPYGTGQLWRKEPRLAASFAALFVDDGERTLPVASAVVYLPTHRTRPVDPTAGLRFGFRAVSAVTEADRSALVRLFELDVARARRLAHVVLGFQLTDTLHVIADLAPDENANRGTRALARVWNGGKPDPNMAQICDVADRWPRLDLAQIIESSGIDPRTVQRALEPQCTLDGLVASLQAPLMPGLAVAGDSNDAALAHQVGEWAAACATDTALVTGLAGLRQRDEYAWDGMMNVGQAMADNLGDCFPTQAFGASFSTPHEAHATV